jgi:hypothetical protein
MLYLDWMISVCDFWTVYAIIGNGWLGLKTGAISVWNNFTQGLFCGRDFPTNINFYREQLLNMKPSMCKATCKSISMYVIWNRNRNVMCNMTQNEDIYIVLEIYCYVNWY